MWSLLLGLIPGLLTTVNGITTAISNERIARINAATDQEKVEIDERIKTLEAQRDVLIADSTHSSLDLTMRTILAAGPAFILAKIFIFDKGLAWYDASTTLSPDLWNVIMVTIGFYFLHNSVVGVAKEFNK
jgi:hypothetical protein